MDEINDAFLLYMDLIQDQFYYDIKEILDTTKCARAKREIMFENGVPVLQTVNCTKEKEICDICPFWQMCKKEVEQILEQDRIAPQIKTILRSAMENEKEYRGRNCMTLGDVVISLEALQGDHQLGVCSSNKKDFQPLCDAIGVKLVTPDYSWKK